MFSNVLHSLCLPLLLSLLVTPVQPEVTGDDGCPTDTCFCFARQVIECTELYLKRAPRFLPNATNITFSEIDLSVNRIRYLGPESFRYVSVQSIKLWRNNRRVNLTLHSRSLHGLEPVLEKFSFRKNSIPHLPLGLFRGFPKLKIVDLSINRVESIRRGVFGYGREAVETLNLDKNLIQNLEEKVFSSLVQLKELTLSRNLISFVDSRAFLGLHNVLYLDLSYNRIRDLQPKVFSSLRNLKQLDLANNAIPALFPVMFRGLKKLEVLVLSNNPIIMIARQTFATMVRLTELRLDKSKLAHLKPGAFQGLISLQTIYLQDSGLRTLPDELFSGMRALTKIQMESNELRTLNACAFDFGLKRTRTDIWVNGNPMHCDCSVAWSARYGATVRVHGLCKTPRFTEGQEIIEQKKYQVCTRQAGMENCPQHIKSETIGSKRNWIRIH